MSLVRNVANNFGTQVTIAAGSLISSVAVARCLGPKSAGTYSLLVYLGLVGSTLGASGLPTTVTASTARKRAEGDPSGAMAVYRWAERRAVLLSLAIALAALFAALFGWRPGEGSTLAVVLAIAIVVPASYAAVATAAWQGAGRFDQLLRRNAIATPIGLALVISAALTRSLTAVVAAAFVSTVISAAAVSRPNLGTTSRQLALAEQRALIAYALPVSLIVIMDVVVWERSEVLFLGAFHSTQVVAFYAIPFALITRVMSLVPGSVTGVLLQRFAGEQTSESVDATFALSIRALTMLSAPLMAMGVAFGPTVVRVLYGAPFLPAGAVFRVLAISAGLAAIVTAASSLLYGTGGQAFMAKLSVVIALVNIGLDFALIPPFGALGAAFANGATQFLGILAGLIYVGRHEQITLPVRRLGLAATQAALAATIAWAATLSLAGSPLVRLVAGAAVFALLYPALLLGAGGFTHAERSRLLTGPRRLREATADGR